MIFELFEARRLERERKAKREAAVGAAAGIAVGVVLGAALGILFAPKSGEETREDIARVTKDTYGKCKDTVKNVITETGERIKDFTSCECDIGNLDEVFTDNDDDDEDEAGEK